MTSKITSILKIIFVIVAISIAIQWLLPKVTAEEFQNYVTNLGILGPLIVIAYTVVSHVAAPVSGSLGVVWLCGFWSYSNFNN